MFKKILFFLVLSATTMTAHATADQIVCTMEYAPVCATVPVQCITAPCAPVKQTFSNSCMAGAAGATVVSTGSCDGTPMVAVDPGYVGGDTDVHGCKASAGYKWNALANACLRPWESRVRVMTVAPSEVTCVGAGLQSCLRIRLGLKKWTNLYSGITGFDYTPGYMYRLQVLETRTNNPPADAPSTEYSLLKILSQKATASVQTGSLLGKWTLATYNMTTMTSTGYTLNLHPSELQAKFCNNLFGSYSLSGNTILAPVVSSTMMYCEGQSMTLENAFKPNQATYALKPIVLTGTLPSSMPTIQLVITTASGNTFTYVR